MVKANPEKSFVNEENQLATTQDVLPEDYNERIQEAKRQNKALMTLMDELLEEGIDYGKEKGIPKPFLHQPGAQQLMLVFKFTPEFEIINKEIEFNQKPAFISYDVKCKLKQRERGQFLGEGVGSCNNYEEKYKYRWKTDDNGNRYREVYEDPMDNMNTLLKMAKKRAMVDAVLNVTGAARLFTQDPDLIEKDNYSEPDSKKEPGDVMMNGGQYKGESIAEIYKQDVSYLKWVAENWNSEVVKNAAKKYIEKQNKEKKEKQVLDREKEIKELIGGNNNNELKKELMDYLRYIKDEKGLKEVTINDLEKEEYQELKDILLKLKKMAS